MVGRELDGESRWERPMGSPQGGPCVAWGDHLSDRLHTRIAAPADSSQHREGASRRAAGEQQSRREGVGEGSGRERVRVRAML
jgi:hypothetical protein